MRKYKKKNVLQASQERISLLFDMYEHISVSISGGKDSSVLLDLTVREAARRNRMVEVMFIDQEAEYAHTIEVIRESSQHPNVHMVWYQTPFKMTNAVSYEQDYLDCWDGNQIRQLEPNHVTLPTSDLTWEQLLKYLDKQVTVPTARLLGLRSAESLNRYRAVTKNPAVEGINWSSKTGNKLLTNFYPIYDYGFDDVWKYLYDHKVNYNKVYDWMFAKGFNKNEMRVSCLIHEKSFHCLASLPEFEPDTYQWLCRRVKGIPTAMRYSKEGQMYSADKLPSGYQNWQQFRDFLLTHHPNDRQRLRFLKRFKGQPQDETVFRQQVAQLLINDWEGITDINTTKEAQKQERKEKWRSLL